MSHGTVKFFNAGKGFGFITPDDGSKDVFVPAASVSAAGLGTLKPGQRVSFEVKPDARGPMAIDLVQLAEPPRLDAAKNGAPQHRRVDERQRLTFYLDSADDSAVSALEDLRAAGHDPKVVDYVATPPRREELRALSMLLSNKNQSLVKRYAPLFYDLRLNDRFLSQNEYWDAIVEHPSLINGPIISTAADANLYSAKSGVDAFLATHFPNIAPVVRQTKPVPPVEDDELDDDEEDVEGVDEISAVEEDEAESADEMVKSRTKSKTPAAAKAKAAKPKPAAKKAVAKPANKPVAKAPARKPKK